MLTQRILKKKTIYPEVVLVSENENKLIEAQSHLLTLDIPVYLFLINKPKTTPFVIEAEKTADIKSYFYSPRTPKIYLVDTKLKDKKIRMNKNDSFSLF